MSWGAAEAARAQMGLSLAFHMVFAAVGVAMPALMVAAELRWRRTGEREWLDLARAWAQGTAVLFAVGAVSGTVLAFELWLLFPGLMSRFGAVLGPAFALEGVAFFSEAICLGLYLYGRERIGSRLHLATGFGVAVSGLASAALVTCANAWMQTPAAFALGEGGAVVAESSLAVFLSPYAPHLLVHSILAVYVATGCAVAAVHAVGLLRQPGRSFHRRALGLALWMVVPASLLQPLVGHWAGQRVARLQPLKLAAMEGQFETEAWAPLRLGGFPDHEARQTRWALELPGGLSFLAHDDPRAVVVGMEEFPPADWPSPVVHYAFQVMVAAGTYLALLSGLALGARLRRGEWPCSPRWLKAFVVAGPLGFVALETGWVVAEVGRQPWVVYGVQRTADTVTPVPGIGFTCALFALLYVGLGAATWTILRGLFAPTLAPSPAPAPEGSAPPEPAPEPDPGAAP